MPATGSILLDTAIVVSVLRRVPGMQQRLNSAVELWLPLFALGELEYGVNHSTQRHALSMFLQAVVILVPREATAREYGRIKAELARAGMPIPEMTYGSPHRLWSTIYLGQRSTSTSAGCLD
jgi:predicted nucleic acid-binding protein